MRENYTSDFVAFHSALTREYYLHLSGLKDELELSSIYERYSDLFTEDAIAKLQSSFDDTSEHFETDRSALRRLLTFAVERFLEDSAKHLTEEISNYEHNSIIEWKGQRLTFQGAIPAIKNEADRPARRELYNKYLAAIDRSNDLRAEKWMRIHETAISLGYTNYQDLFQKLRGVDYYQIAWDVERLLSTTESIYVSRLNDDLRREMGIGLEDADRSDSLRAFRLTAYDHQFPADRLLHVYRATMDGLGINVYSQTNIEIDSQPRPRKSSRPFCASISIPAEIKLVILPTGGQSDYQGFFHEVGHVQHYGWTSSTLRPEFKYTSDYALTETYAFLFNHLVMESDWLTEMLGFVDNTAFIRSALLNKLMLIRRYAGKLIYECDLHSGRNIAQASDKYSETLTDATKFQTSGVEFLFDLDDAFYSANYLRAWAFEVMLHEYLKVRFGRRWWTSRGAGSFLKDIWETGDRYSADEMASQIGIGPISFEPLIDEFNNLLKKART
jgi:hypothetical protein